MTSQTFAAYLAGLAEPDLVALLHARSDVLVRPLPRGFEQLAQRLDSPRSLNHQLGRLNRDYLRVGLATAIQPDPPTAARLAAYFTAPVDAVERIIDDLAARGLAWREQSADAPGEPVVRLPSTLLDHWRAEFSHVRTVAQLARSVLVDDLRTTARALGADAAGLRKPELTQVIAARLADPRRVAAILANLPADALEMLDELQDSGNHAFVYPRFPGSVGRSDNATVQALLRTGLLLPVNGRPELPREVCIARWLVQDGHGLSGPPDIPRPAVEPASVASAAQAAAQEAVRTVTTLLDEASASPLAALKRGGIGSRERQRISRRLTLPLDDLPLWIDLAMAAGLLNRLRTGYGPGRLFTAWRDASPSRQWAALALAWLNLRHAPTARDSEPTDERDAPAPPMALDSEAGRIRRILLDAAAGGRSARLTATHLAWIMPLQGYSPPTRDLMAGAAIREAELLGVIAADVLTGLGEALIGNAPGADAWTIHALFPSGDPGLGTLAESIADAASHLATHCDTLLPTTPTSLILQSDLTALIAGQPTTAMAHLLRAAAEPESRGTAATWRFTPASVRTAMDAGWTAETLLDTLRSHTDRDLPQALHYLITDVARRHGHVRIRGLKSAILADEPTIMELLHTRILAKLHLARLAPTVLSSPEEPATVLAELRRAGFSPMPEDATGTIILTANNPLSPPTDKDGSDQSTAEKPDLRGARTDTLRSITPEILIAQLHTDEKEGVPKLSPVAEALSDLNHHLNSADIAALADAIEKHHDIIITYRDKNGNITVRPIRPEEFSGKWIYAWCHLRNDDREFTVSNIQSVTPVA